MAHLTPASSLDEEITEVPDETTGFADEGRAAPAQEAPGAGPGVRQVLHENTWVSLMAVREPALGVDGYVYSHETRCGGRIVAVLPYRDGERGRQYLVKPEMTPCWSSGQVRSAITGGWEGGEIADDAVREMLEETGYAITRDELIPLGESYASKSADTVYSLFSADLTGREPGEATGDGTRAESESAAVWVSPGELARMKDPQLHVMFLRLLGVSGIPAGPAVAAATGAQPGSSWLDGLATASLSAMAEIARLREHIDVDRAVDRAAAGPAPGGRFMTIAFFGHIEHTGYVTEVTLHGGQAAYRIDLPEKLWGGNPLAWREYAASALFEKNPVTEESVRAAWEAQRERAEKWRRQQEEWDRAQSQPALPAGRTRPCGCGPTEECSECRETEPF